YGLGLVGFETRDFQAAAHWFTKSLKVNPKGENSLFYLAEIALIRGDRESAGRLFAGVLTLNPKHAGALRRLIGLAVPASSTASARANAPSVSPQRTSAGAGTVPSA